MAEWIEIPPTALIESHRSRFFRSPFDVPIALRPSFDALTRRFHIELRYIGGDEPTQSFTATDRVTVLVGQRSYRVYGLVIDGRDVESPADLIALVQDATKELRKKARALENYDATSEALDRKKPQIMSQLAAASAW